MSKQKVKYSYQLTNELLPAEWLPMSKTFIFFLGARSDKSNPFAMVAKPEMYNNSNGVIQKNVN